MDEMGKRIKRRAKFRACLEKARYTTVNSIAHARHKKSHKRMPKAPLTCKRN
jgi:hypothetical protein